MFSRLFRKGSVSQYPSEELVAKLWLIGCLKRAMPFRFRGNVNYTGLYVQLRFAGSYGRLMAGGKVKHQSSIWYTKSPDYSPTEPPWILDRIDKYSPGPWEQLAQPALEIAAWLYLYHQGALSDPTIDARIAQAIAELQNTGEWVFLDERETTIVQALIQRPWQAILPPIEDDEPLDG